MVHERRRQHLLGQLEEAALEKPGDDAGILDEIGDFLDQGGVLLQQHAAAEAPRVQLELARDAIAPLAVIEHDEVLGQPRLVFVEAAHLDRPAGAAARRQKAMAVGDGAGLDVLHLRTGRTAACGRW